MKSKIYNAILLVGISILLTAAQARACTSILVTQGASKDNSVMITYSCDGEFLPYLECTPAMDHEEGEMYEIRRWDGTLVNIPQVAHTYAVVGFMNEFQLSIGETTTTGREELRNPDGLLHYWTLMNLALQRAKTAREAVKEMVRRKLHVLGCAGKADRCR